MFQYLVLLLVAVAFLGVCRFFFYTPAPKRRAPYVPRDERRDLRARVRDGSRPLVRGEGGPTFAAGSVAEAARLTATQPIPLVTDEPTKEVPRVSLDERATNPEMEETQVVSREVLHQMMEAEPTREVPVLRPQAEPEPEVTAEEDIEALLEDTQSLLRQHVRHFLVRYARVTPDLAHDAEVVTEHCLARLGDRPDAEVRDMLSHIMVQEALTNAQRVYVMMPDSVVLAMVSSAFAQVALGERNETLTLLAYDALDVWTHMDHGHFRILALLLLFHYSRNTNNTSAAAFRRYAKKYVEPLLTDLPTEYSYYQQLEYLQCVSLSQTDLPFTEILRESYPLFFNYEGFTEEELTQALEGGKLRAEFTVRSLYGDYYKFPVADTSGLADFYRRAGVKDKAQREALTQLTKLRPIHPDRREAGRLVQTLAPSLGALNEAWDGSMLRRSAPTLLGMYIGREYVKEVIGEDFDLSRWL